MSVSDDGLEEAIQTHEDVLRFGVMDYETIPQQEKFIGWLRELQRYRQAATAGVEGAANKLVMFVEAKISEYLPGDFTLTDDDAQAVRDLLTALLAPYVAKSAGVEEAAKRIAEKISESLAGDYYATFDQDNERPIIAAELTALLAERDAVLSECREVAAYVANTLSQIPTHQRSAATRIIDRIEALTKGVGDGK